MKNKYRILKIFMTVLSLVFLLCFSLNRFGEQEQKLKIHFSDDIPIFFINDSIIKHVVKKNNPSNKIKKINIGETERKIKELPSVEYVNVYLELNGTLNVEIKQKIPVMRINNSDNQYYVDDMGNEFPLSKEYSHPCILVSGKIPAEDYANLAILINKIKKDDLYKNYFIGISKFNEDYMLLTNDGYFKIQFGNLENIDIKLMGLKVFIEKYLYNKNHNIYKQISVKYNGQIVATLRKGVGGSRQNNYVQN